jgi:hypothetical protein
MTTPQLKLHREAALNPEAFVFERVEWNFKGDCDENLQIQGKTGSWCKPPSFAKKTAGFALALVCCPNCTGVSALAKGVTVIDGMGKLSPDFQCTHPRCGFRRIAYVDMWLEKKLYAMSYWERGKIAHKYTHAKDLGEAVLHLGARREDVIAIAPAIGFFVNDKKGDDLSTD